MAIAKMQKISIVTTPTQKNNVLYTLQTLQSVEISDLIQKIQDSEEVDKPQVSVNEESDSLENYERTERALEVLKQYTQKVPLKKRLLAKRPQLTMNQLNEQVDDESALALVDKVEKLKTEREDINENRTEIEQNQNDISNWRALPYAPKELQSLDTYDIRLGTVPEDDNRTHFNALLNSEIVGVSEVYSNEDEVGVIIVADPTVEQAVDETLNEHHFQKFEYSYEKNPDEMFEQLEAERKQLIDKEENVVSQLQGMQKDILEIKLAAEEFYNRAQRDTAGQMAYENEQLLLFSGWVVANQIEELKKELEDRFTNNEFALILEETSEQEVEDDEVPVQLKNNRFVSPFETVVEMYGLPHYYDKDPTNWVTVFYLIFFGMMMGDIGYGIIMWIVTLLALKLMDLKSSARRFMVFGHLLSYPTMIVGFIYGSLFGVTMPWQIIDPMGNALMLMIISIGIGLVHIIVALSLNVYLEIGKGNYADAYNDGIGWLLMLFGMIIGIVGWISPWSFLLNVGVIMAIIGAVGIVAVPIFTSKNKGVGLAVGAYNLYGVSSYVGDFVSYTRLMALGISSASIAMAFNTIFNMLPVPVRFTAGILLIIVLHLFNMFLSLLSAYVHGLRLIFVEFFGKFYDAGGKAFAPIKTLQEYVSIKDVRENK